MPKMIITHGVVDIDTWLAGKSERAAAVADMGGRNALDHVAYDGSNNIAISADVDDVDEMMAKLSSPPPEVGSLMEKHGVVPPLTAYVAR